jgi:hypothetical protein
MIQKENSVLVSLTGGLGNQLFQLAAGLNLAGKSKVYLSTTLGAPRLSLSGKAELLSFTLPARVKTMSDLKAGWITRKAAGFMLRMGVAPSLLERTRLFTIISGLLANLIMGIHFRQKIVVSALSGVGYSPIRVSKSNTLLLGYFQSYRWAENFEIKKELSSITYVRESKKITKYFLDSKTELPLIVHVRLGDYLLEKNFGVPSKDYYEKSILKILQTGKCNSIWLFSDELEKAQSYIPDSISIPVRLISEIDESPAATLEVMRMGAGYVIANSTFSWWAAFLRKNEHAEVIAPMPWFSGMPEPVDLIPNNWQRINSGFASGFE